MEVMLLVAQGDTSKQIGEKLFVSPRTVEMHVHGSLPKLRADAVRRLAELGALPQSRAGSAGARETPSRRCAQRGGR
jgi:ATP/maltotriose-dependent transcriptional regulator MalT